MKARYISVLNSKGNIFFRRLRTATVRWLWYPFFTLSWILGFVLMSAFLRPVLGGLGQFLYMHFLDLTLGIRFEPVWGGLILIISKSNHITMTSTARVTSITNHYICVLHWEIGSCLLFAQLTAKQRTPTMKFNLESNQKPCSMNRMNSNLPFS